MSFLEPGAACRFSSGGWCWAHASLKCADDELIRAAEELGIDLDPVSRRARPLPPRPVVQCEKCGADVTRRDDHYVSSVGHLTDPDDAIQPYWMCERECITV